MFWDKSYTPHNIDALLAKAVCNSIIISYDHTPINILYMMNCCLQDVSVEEFLEEDDIIQECKTQKKVLLN